MKHLKFWCQLGLCSGIIPGNFVFLDTHIFVLLQLLDQALANPDQAKFLCREVIDQYRGFGGVSTVKQIKFDDDKII